MRKQPRVGVYLDYMHKGFVCTCIAATLYGASYLLYKTYNYYANVRPEFQKIKDKANKQLLAEGSSEDLDTAPTLKM